MLDGTTNAAEADSASINAQTYLQEHQKEIIGGSVAGGLVLLIGICVAVYFLKQRSHERDEQNRRRDDLEAEAEDARTRSRGRSGWKEDDCDDKGGSSSWLKRQATDMVKDPENQEAMRAGAKSLAASYMTKQQERGNAPGKTAFAVGLLQSRL